MDWPFKAHRSECRGPGMLSVTMDVSFVNHRKLILWLQTEDF